MGRGKEGDVIASKILKDSLKTAWLTKYSSRLPGEEEIHRVSNAAVLLAFYLMRPVRSVWQESL